MLNEEERTLIRQILAPYLADEKVLSMGRYIQHGSVTTLAHCLAVVDRSYELARDLHLLGRIDLPVMLRAALLHDFYLYDWHEKDRSHAWHGFHHATRAMINARERFGIGEHEQAIIRSHMWPLNPARLPRSREAWIVTVADKIVAARETLFARKKRRAPEKADGGEGKETA